MLLLFESLPFKGVTQNTPSQLVEELIQALNEEIENIEAARFYSDYCHIFIKYKGG